MDTRALAAARNNVHWCDLICRLHGVATTTEPVGWFAHSRTPALFPDAVTLRPEATVAELLPRIDSSAGCSIKDSFASLDLAGEGFRVLFEAEWLYREPGPRRAANRLRWNTIRTVDELARWESAAGEGVIRLDPSLLDHPDIAVLLAFQDAEPIAEPIAEPNPEPNPEPTEPVAGLVANRGGGAVGLSNVFTAGADLAQVWAEGADAAGAVFGGLPLVGYESAPQSLRAAHRAGFAGVGPLRIWLS